VLQQDQSAGSIAKAIATKALSATTLIDSTFNLAFGIQSRIKRGLKMRQIKIIVTTMLAVLLVGCASSPGRTSSAPSQNTQPMFEQMPGNFTNPPGAPDSTSTPAPEAGQ
jgi:hypothetical protein